MRPSCFNSKVVRLKAGSMACGMRLAAWFQFQSGAVKSRLEREIREAHGSFNSKVVRLKEEMSSASVGCKPVSIPKWCG